MHRIRNFHFFLVYIDIKGEHIEEIIIVSMKCEIVPGTYTLFFL
jgi:hypothetical protein